MTLNPQHFHPFMLWSFCVQLFDVRGGYSCCWYWWNCSSSLFKLSFYNVISLWYCKCVLSAVLLNLIQTTTSAYVLFVMLLVSLSSMECTAKSLNCWFFFVFLFFVFCFLLFYIHSNVELSKITRQTCRWHINYKKKKIRRKRRK